MLNKVKKVISATLILGMLVTMNASIVSAKIALPGRTTPLNIDMKPGTDNHNLTKSNYLADIAAQGVDTTSGKEIVPIVWGPYPAPGANPDEPVGDGMDLFENPTVYTGADRNIPYAKMGIIDVTAGPFHAPNDGIADATQEIQDAIEFGKKHQMAVFFPAGTYLVSDTILIRSGISLRTGTVVDTVANKNEMPTVLLGSRTGQATIKLKNNTPGFNATADPSQAHVAKAVIHYYQPDIDKSGDITTIKYGEKHGSDLEGNIMIDNLDINTGYNNPRAIGLVMSSAQGGVLQDVQINAFGSLAGIVGGSGNGGSWTNVTINGGKYGIDSRTTTILVPSMHNIKIQNQETAAWLAGAAGSTVVTGLKIVAPYKGPAIVRTSRAQPMFGSLTIIDAQIEYTDPYAAGTDTHYAIAGSTDNLKLIDSEFVSGSISTFDMPNLTPNLPEGLYMNNVYFKNVGKVLKTAAGADMTANASGWYRFDEYATSTNQTWSGITFQTNPYINKVQQTSSNTYNAGGTSGATPPADLQSRHGWTAGQFPNFQTTGAVNVKTQYNAKGDGTTDDTAALQKAIDENNLIFLPKGYYRITKTLTLNENTKLFGVSPAFSYIMTDVHDIGVTGRWNNGVGPVPMVQTSPLAGANNVISDLTITPTREVPDSYSGNYPLYAIKWQAGGNSRMRAVQIEPTRTYGFIGSNTTSTAGNNMKAARYIHPLMLITGNGGGKIYNVYAQLFEANVDPAMSLLAIDGKNTNIPLALYATNWEYLKSNTTVKIDSSKYVSIYGSKTEDNTTYMHINNSDHIRIFAHSGSGTAPYENVIYRDTDYVPPTGSDIVQSEKGNLFKVETTPNFLIANLSDQVTKVPVWNGKLYKNPYDLYFPIKAGTDAVPSTHRPVIYKIGNPLGSPAP